MRQTLSLDGDWAARLDPDNVGEREGWFAADMKFERVLRVPLPWQVADPTLRQYAGVVWYRRDVAVPDDWAAAALALRFGAVDYRATVWVNGQMVGQHEGGYTPFELEIGAAVERARPFQVVLRVEDPPNLDEIPHGKQGGRWYTAISGPWQSIELLDRPSERILAVHCRPGAGLDRVQLAISTNVASQADDARTIDSDERVAAERIGSREGWTVEVDVIDADGRVAARGAAPIGPRHRSAMLEPRLDEPRRWDPDSPHLYSVLARLIDGSGGEVDRLEARFGLRTIEVRAGQILLNGQPLYMRGALDQAYWPETLYTVPSDAEIEREIRLTKEMGLNLLRKHIKPEDPRYLEAADRLGLLIWAEPANPATFSATACAALRRDLLEMIARDVNHPSVIIWSLYNEDWGLPGLWSDAEKQGWLRDLYHEVKAIDPTRLVCDDSGWAHVVTDLNDYHEYYAAPERMARLRERLDFIAAHPEDNFAHPYQPTTEPRLVSEFGNWGLPDPALGRARSGGVDPYWYAYDQAYARAAGLPPSRPESRLTEQIKTIAGFEERFARLGLAAAFDSPAALCAHLQRRAFRALKSQIEEMRVRPDLRGYVVTELTDLEWEANGWLDYWRQPKSFHADLADINAPIAVILRPTRPSWWGGETVTVDVTLANTTAGRVDGLARWRLVGDDQRGSLPISAPPFENGSAPAAIRFWAPSARPMAARLEVTVEANGATIARGYAELAFVPPASGRVESLVANATLLDRTFRQHLERQGYRIPRAFDDAARLAIVDRLDDTAWRYLEGGGRVVYLADLGEGIELAGLRVTALAAGESWRMASGAAWARADRLAPAPVLPELGWEVADIFPGRALTSESLQPGDEQIAGWLEGWLANTGAFVIARRVGRGRLVATTFRFERAYGVDPVATALLNRLVEIALEE